MKMKKRYIIHIIASLVLFFSMIKIQFYLNNTSGFHDMPAHLGYLVYVEEHENELIPDFHEMKLLQLTGDNEYKNVKVFNDKINTEWKVTNQLNYLGHPPLYYKIINMFNPISFNNDIITFDMQKISIINMIIVGIGIILLMYIGILFELKPLQFLFYSISCTSIPLITYLGGALNNDNLAYIGISILFIALININKGKDGYFSYLLMATGLFICMMTKLTIGLLAAIVILLYFGWYVYKNKNVEIICNKKFFITSPIYFVVLLYYMIVMFKYGTVQPSLKSMDFEYFKTTGFYVEPIQRVTMNIFQYIRHFLKGFFATWIEIHSHTLVRVHYKLEGIIYSIILIAPALYLIYSIVYRKKLYDNKQSKLILIGCISILLTMVAQFIKCAKGFYSDGYLGANQARYYTSCVFIMSLGILYIVEGIINEKYRWVKNSIYILLSIIMISYDFKFFIS